jgi:hypothetical protein
MWFTPLLPGAAEQQSTPTATSFGGLLLALTGTLGDPATATITGTAAQTLDGLGQSAAGAVRVAASASQTLASLTQIATSGTVTVGTAAQTLGSVTQAASGAVRVAGSATQTLGALTQAASGTVGAVSPPAEPVTGGQIVKFTDRRVLAPTDDEVSTFEKVLKRLRGADPAKKPVRKVKKAAKWAAEAAQEAAEELEGLDLAPLLAALDALAAARARDEAILAYEDAQARALALMIAARDEEDAIMALVLAA